MKGIVTIGEVLLRLSTEEGKRFSQSSSLDMHLGGSEFNVAINMANFGHQTRFASIIPPNPIGDLVLENLTRHKVNTDFIETKGDRLGTYYLESGSAMKAPRVVYDRKQSSFFTSKVDWNLDSLFADISILHISGITIALSDYWLTSIIEIINFAKEKGIKISFDMNYRAKLWDIDNARKAYQKILPLIDYCSAGSRDALAFFNVDKDEKDYYLGMKRNFPNIKVFYATKRNVRSASHHQLQGNVWCDGQLYTSNNFNVYPVIDRVGTGDAFTSGILHMILSGHSFSRMVEFATANAVLKHSIKGDTNVFKVDEIESFLNRNSYIIR